MNYIINPSWFYLISIADNLIKVSTLGIFVGVVACAASIGLKIEVGDEYAKKCFRFFVIVFPISILAYILIPSKETLIEMQVAKFATYENAEWTVETVKGAVDYIVEAIKTLNG